MPTLRLAIRPDYIQPEPISTITTTTPDGQYTAIARVWRDGEPIRCALCPLGQCRAANNTCLIMVPGRVGPERGRLFDTSHIPPDDVRPVVRRRLRRGG